ncbi:MAG TPA: hypothetical protein VF064_03760 [Pyrinomonadaceae bacterium]
MRRSVAAAAAVILALSLSPAFVGAQKKDEKKKDAKGAEADKPKEPPPQGTPVLWRERNIESLDLFRGEGQQPDLSKITFVREDTSGTSKKYRVTDAAGREWVVKVGSEAQSETAAVRLVWAAGYQTEIVHLAPSVDIVGKGNFKNVRFELRTKERKRHGHWLWAENPFAGKRELQGLKLLMALINNWDLKDDNNVIISGAAPGEVHYAISDLGATFGKTGSGALWKLKRSRNNPEDYAKSKFINGVKDGRVDLTFSGVNAEMMDNITVADARWLGQLLARLSDKQLGDVFRAANYTPAEITMLTQAARARINELARLPEGTVSRQ